MTRRAKALVPAKSKLPDCEFQLDRDTPPASKDDGDQVCTCGFPRRHLRHNPDPARQAATQAAQAEHLRRIGDDP